MRFLLLLALPLALAAQDLPFTWNATGSLLTPRHHACAAPLPGRRVLVTGGIGPDGTPLASAEIYSAADGVFTDTAPMAIARAGHSCIALPDGRVLVVSGGSAELFNPADSTWSQPTSQLKVVRDGQTVTLLQDGSVLLAGGTLNGGTATGVLERFDSQTDTFVLLKAPLATPRAIHTAALLGDGRVFIGGGQKAPGSNALDSTEIVDPYNQIVQPGPVLPEARMRHTATTLVDGRILVAGGRAAEDSPDLASTLFVNASGDELQPGPSLAVARSSAQAVPILGNGGVLMIGGVSGDTPLASTELLNADATEFSAFGDLKLARDGLAASPVGESGSVLSVGGVVDGTAIGVCGKTSGDAVQSDRSAYVQGDTAVITGTWIEKESVKVVATFFNTAGSIVQERSFQINNLTGTFTVSLNGLFAGQTVRVRASGETSLSVAVVTFPVSSPTTVTLTTSPTGSVQAPARPTFTIRVHPAVGGMGAPQGAVVLRDGNKVLTKLFTTDPSVFSFAANGDGVFTLTPTLPVEVYSLGADFIRSGGFVDSASTSGSISFRIDGVQPRQYIAMEGVPADVVALAQSPFISITGKSRMLGSINISGGLVLPAGSPPPTGTFSLFEDIAGTLSPAGSPLTPVNVSNVNGSIYAAYFNLPANRLSRDKRNFVLKFTGDLLYPPFTRNLAIIPAGFVPRINYFAFNPPGTTFGSPIRVNDPIQVTLTFEEINGFTPGFGPCPPDQTTCPSGLELKWLRDNDVLLQPFAAPQRSPTPNNGAFFWFFSSQLPSFSSAGPHTVKFRYFGHYYYDDLEFERQVNVQKGVPVKAITATSPISGSVTIIVDLDSACLVTPNPITGNTCPSINQPDGTWRIFEGKTELTSTLASPRMTFNLQASPGVHTYTVFYAGNTQWEGVSTPVSVTVK